MSSSPAAPYRTDLHAKPHSKNAKATFMREFFRNPGGTAAIAPSSRALARQMLHGIDLSQCKSIVEFGPGTGVFTSEILHQLPKNWSKQEGGQGTFISIEFNPTMAQLVRDHFPNSCVRVRTDSAANVEAICASEGIQPGSVDLIVSGLGFASFPFALTTEVLEASVRTLAGGGQFRTFSYHMSLLLGKAWHFRKEANRLFSKFEVSRTVWKNMPPAFVYTLTK